MASPCLHFSVIGHSFVRRADQHLQSIQMNNLGLPLFSHKVEFLGLGGAHILDLIPLFQSSSNLPDVVIIDIGTNDLTNYRAPPHTLALQVFNVARRLITHHNVAHVVILQVLPRTTWGRHGQPQSFCSRVSRFNAMLESLVYQYKARFPVSCWMHKGMRSNINNFISDGVHLNPLGLTKYIKSIKRAILAISRSIRATRSFYSFRSALLVCCVKQGVFTNKKCTLLCSVGVLPHQLCLCSCLTTSVFSHASQAMSRVCGVAHTDHVGSCLIYKI